ncbi:putative endonuclease-reverse transcriptase [Trichonephila clavipes]|nr:putative endonuclease-reverse transcriptase [Trichonephila clavipes]
MPCTSRIVPVVSTRFVEYIMDMLMRIQPGNKNLNLCTDEISRSSSRNRNYPFLKRNRPKSKTYVRKVGTTTNLAQQRKNVVLHVNSQKTRPERIYPLVENTVGDYPNGLWKGRYTTEQIFNIRQVLEKIREFEIDMHHLFIDFKTTYDSIHRKTLIAAMKEFKIPDKLLRLISLTLSETKIVVKVQNDLSDT